MGPGFVELFAFGVLSFVEISAGGSCSTAKLCCEGRDSGCVIQKASPNAIIESPQDKPCYCDHACLKLNDCCDDFRDACRVVDCAVGEWEEWSPCGNRCGAGVQTRTRSIVQPTTNGGKHCPQLEQSRTCHSFIGCSRNSRISHLKDIALRSRSYEFRELAARTFPGWRRARHVDNAQYIFDPCEVMYPSTYDLTGYILRNRMQTPIDIPRDYTASDLDEEHRVAYWREDVGINLHHWHWHLVYPFDGDRSIVAKDRRGELFYYMHQQILARYNTERLCNHLGRVNRFNNIREPISEGYFPKLNALVASKTWPSRPSGTQLKDINRPVDGVIFDLHTLERWRDSIYNAIHTDMVTSSVDQKKTPLTEKDDIDILGNIMEASILSPNPKLYGDLHNLGHVAISFCHDPDHRHLECTGIMGDSATAMRDPIFYRWHAFINDIFMEHKNILPEYNVNQLNFAGIEVSGVELITPYSPSNSMMTFWTQSDLDLSRGLDFAPSGPILARFTHLNHTDFRYRIIANNQSNTTKKGTVRIFIARNVDERGMVFDFQAQKDLMIEMDKFTVSRK